MTDIKIILYFFLLLFASCGNKKETTIEFPYKSASINSINCQNCILLTIDANKIFLYNYKNIINNCDQGVEITLNDVIEKNIFYYNVEKVSQNCYGVQPQDNFYIKYIGNDLEIGILNNNILFRRD